MTKLEQARKKINEIDEKMAKLFEERMEASKEVALYKKENALPIVDKMREKELILKNSKYVEDVVIGEYYVNFLQSVMDLSKKYQFRLLEGQKVGYCGVEGAFGHIAAKKMFNNATLLSFKNFEETYHAVENGSCDVAILPIENSYAGDVGTVMDLIFSGSLFINQILDLDVVHHLIGTVDASIDTIKTVYSHPQALSQCSDYLKSHHFKEVEYANTALAAKEIAKLNDNTIASIASVDTAELYGLKVIESNIPGVTGEITWERTYPYGDTLKNIFGKVGPITKENKDYYLNEGYELTDTVGLSYLEKEYEEYLKGEKAKYKVESDYKLVKIEDEKKGNDLVLSIDIDLQMKVDEILRDKITLGKKYGNTEYFKDSYAIISNPLSGAILAISGQRLNDDNAFSDISLNTINKS